MTISIGTVSSGIRGLRGLGQLNSRDLSMSPNLESNKILEELLTTFTIESTGNVVWESLDGPGLLSRSCFFEGAAASGVNKYDTGKPLGGEEMAG